MSDIEEEKRRREWFWDAHKNCEECTMGSIYKFFKQKDDINDQLVIEYYTDGVEK